MPSTQTQTDILQHGRYQGEQVSRIPSAPGLYAWYYRPLSTSVDAATRILAQFLDTPASITTIVQQRYGVRLVSRSTLLPVFGPQEQTAISVLGEAAADAANFISWFLASPALVTFTRPIYIGIAKNLYERVYNQHFRSLTEYWDSDSRVSRLLAAMPDISVQSVMDRLELPHSFALEARVKGIPPRDLLVSVVISDQLPVEIGSDAVVDSTSEPAARRALERMLQLIADPICGRR